jgi:ABC-2 type transport system permease protein
MNAVIAFFLRDLAMERSYRFHFFVKSLAVLFQLSLFYFLSRFILKPDYFPYVFSGLVFSRFFQFWLTVFSENMRQEQYWGTAEAVFLSPRPPLAVLLASTAGKFALLLAELGVYLLLGIAVFGVRVSPGLLMVVPVALVNGAAFAGLGMASAGFIVRWKRGDPVNWLVSSSFDLLSGVYFPVAVLPRALQTVSGFLPTTVALNAWRDILLSGRLPGFEAWALQCLWAVVLMGCGIFVFRRAFTLVRRRGELGNY